MTVIERRKHALFNGLQFLNFLKRNVIFLRFLFTIAGETVFLQRPDPSMTNAPSASEFN